MRIFSGTIFAAMVALSSALAQVSPPPPEHLHPALPRDHTNAYGLTPTGLPPLPASVVQPAMPEFITPPPFPQITGQTITVSTAAQLQPALNKVQCGGAVKIMPGSYVTHDSYTISTVCPPGSFITIYGASVPLESSTERISQTASLPALKTNSNLATFNLGDGASGIYFAGLAFTTVTPMPNGVYPIVIMCDITCTSLAQVPSNIWFDRVQIFAPDPPAATGPFTQRGISMNCTNCGIINSDVWNIVNVGMDAQAVLIDNSPGPVLVWNNYLESSGENFMTNTKMCPTGYCGSGIKGPAVPSAIVTGNTFAKQLSWENGWLGCYQGGTPQCPTVKNEFECKHCQYLVADHNHFINDFAQAQAEFAIINCCMQSTNVCNDITFTNNLFEHGPGGIFVSANGSPQTGQRLLVRNNLFVDLNGATNTVVGTAGSGMYFGTQYCVNCTLDHNTAINFPPQNLWAMSLGQPPATVPSFTYTNNIAYGAIAAPPMSAGGTVAAFPNATWGGDLFVGDTWPNNYPAGNGSPASYATPLYPAGITTVTSKAQPANSAPCNFGGFWPSSGSEINKSIALCWPLDWAAVGLADFAGAGTGKDLAGAALAPNSPYHLKGTDGVDPGANVAAVLSAVAPVIKQESAGAQ